MSIKNSMLAIVVSTTLFATTISLSAINPHFQSGEHISIGNDVKIYLSANDLGQSSYTFELANGLALNYGEILGLGDFYGLVNQPISSGATNAEQVNRFLGAFNSLTNNPVAVNESAKILAILEYDLSTVLASMQNGEKPEDVLNRITTDNNRQFNCITGGGCDDTWWKKPGRYLQLAISDFDHFGDNAWRAYLVGHQVAIATAFKARETNNLDTLKLAYAQNAFACHYLSDRFAAGHLRTPRLELPANVTPSVVGSLLVHYMHDEDDSSGLSVHNLRGDHWMTYGDNYYFSAMDNENRSIIYEAMQQSANEIYAAYAEGVTPLNDSIYQLLPLLDENDREIQQNTSPLFYWDAKEKKLYRRSDLSNLRDYHWTTNWLGWETLIELARLHKLSPLYQAELINAGYGADAYRYGLLSDAGMTRA